MIMESWGWWFGPTDEIKVKKIMTLLNCDDYEKVKKLYLENVVRDEAE